MALAARRVAEREVAGFVAGRVQLDELPRGACARPRTRRSRDAPRAASPSRPTRRRAQAAIRRIVAFCRFGPPEGAPEPNCRSARLGRSSVAHAPLIVARLAIAPRRATQVTVSRSCAAPRTSTVARSPERVSTSKSTACQSRRRPARRDQIVGPISRRPAACAARSASAASRARVAGPSSAQTASRSPASAASASARTAPSGERVPPHAASAKRSRARASCANPPEERGPRATRKRRSTTLAPLAHS